MNFKGFTIKIHVQPINQNDEMTITKHTTLSDLITNGKSYFTSKTLVKLLCKGKFLKTNSDLAFLTPKCTLFIIKINPLLVFPKEFQDLFQGNIFAPGKFINFYSKLNSNPNLMESFRNLTSFMMNDSSRFDLNIFSNFMRSRNFDLVNEEIRRNLREKYRDKIDEIKNMGFGDEEKIIDLFEYYDCDFQCVVDHLIEKGYGV